MARSTGDFCRRHLDIILAATTGLIVFSAYLFLVSPTVCLWDCGEYVAAGYSLGVPHPPGNPLAVCINRVFSIALFFLRDPGLRMNLVASLCGAITAALIFLIIVRVFADWIIGSMDTTVKKLIVYIGAWVGAMFYAFSNTVLFSSVESEVNVPLLVPIMLSILLVLVWAKSRDPLRDRLLLLIAYISFLGIGIHIYSLIALGPAFLFVILVDPQKRTDWRLWLTGMLCGLVFYDISWFLWSGLVGTAITFVMSVSDTRNSSRWRFCFWVFFFALLGYSVHLYIPIRSSLSPMIDENHPANLHAFIEYLQRKQYGSESMITRMFWRRGSWANQFGIEGHMGFGGFFLTQFFRFAETDTQQSLFAAGALTGTLKLSIYLVPAVFMIWAWYYTGRRRWQPAVMLISAVIVCTVVMVLYMNFADGTRPEYRDYVAWVQAGKPGKMPVVYREVRVRDYFYIVGFAFYALWIGLAASSALHASFNHKSSVVRRNVAMMLSVLFFISPALPIVQNAARNSRHGDFLPFDFAWNLLNSCEKDGILITNGDNDTFPLWALQEAYGVRRDVRIVNLSLVNTRWYIKQLRDLEPRVPIALTDHQLDMLEPDLNPFTTPAPYTIPRAGIEIIIPDRKQRNAILVQDKMILNIVGANQWRRPIYFSSTVSEDNFMGLGPYLRMQGLVFRLERQRVNPDERVDLERMAFLLDKVYRFRGLGVQRGNYDETQYGLLSNYAACFVHRALAERPILARMQEEMDSVGRQLMAGGIAAADTALKNRYDTIERQFEQRLDASMNSIDRCMAMMPWDWRPRMLKHEILMGLGRADDAERNARAALETDPENQQYIRMLAQAQDLRRRQPAARPVSDAP